MARGAKDHIIGWAAEDWRTSRIRTRSIMTGDAMLRLVYLELLNALYANAGTLPSDPEELQDYVGLPAAEVARCLPLLVRRDDSSRGGLIIADGQVTCPRVTETLAANAVFRAAQQDRGRRSAALRKPAETPPAEPTVNGGSTTVQPPLNQTPTIPLPSPSPLPTPTPKDKDNCLSGADAPAAPGDGEDEHDTEPAAKTSAADREVYQAWQDSLPEPQRARTRLTTSRRTAIKARRRDGHSQETLLLAAVGWKNDPWPERPQHNDLAILLRPGNVEKFAALALSGRPVIEASRGQPRPSHRGPFAIVRTTPENDAAYLNAPDVYPDAMP